MTAPTSIRRPPNQLVEIELTPGVWTSVTADVAGDADSVGGMSIRYGRSSEFSAPQVASFSVTLRNFDKDTGVYTGKYMPQNPGSPYYPNIVRRKRIRYSYQPDSTVNWLTGTSATFDTGLGTWVNDTNSTPTQTTAQANTGTGSMLMTSIAAGDMECKHTANANILVNGSPVIPGRTITASAWFRAATTPRSCRVRVVFYDASATLISTVAGGSVTNSTTGWTQAAGSFTVPANAAVAVLRAQVLAAGGASEQHYVDDAYINSNPQRMRFTGTINAYQPTLVGENSYTQITASCPLNQFARVKMLSPIRQEITLAKPSLWWPLSDDQGSTQAVEQSGNSGPPLGVVGTQLNPLTFGAVGPGFGDGTGVTFAPGSLSSGQYLSAVIHLPTALTDVGLYVQCTAVPASPVGLVGLDQTPTGGNALVIGINASGRPTVTGPGGASLTSSGASICDGAWHHIYLGFAGSGGGSVVYTLYVDGMSVATQTVSAVSILFAFQRVAVGQTALETNASALFTGSIGQLGFFAGLDGSTIFQQASAGSGYAGDRTDVRISRFLGYTNVGDIGILDSGSVFVGTYPQDGKDVLSGCQDMATTESGGSVFYCTPDGRPRFASRRYRDNRTPKLTLDAGNGVPGTGDLDPSIYQPSLDDANLVTQATVSRETQAGTQTSQTYDNGSTDVLADQVTTYTAGTVDGSATGDADALALAQYLVNLQSVDALRYPQIAVDLAGAAHDLYDAVGQLQIGDRIRLSNLPAVAWPTATLDFFLEGWTETPGDDSYRFVMDVSPADVPGPRAVWDVSTWDGGDVWAL